MTNTDDTRLTTDELNAVLLGAYAVWQYNGHDIPAAVLHVHRRHIDPVVQAAAGQAYDELLTTPIIWRAFEIEFEKRAAADR